MSNSQLGRAVDFYDPTFGQEGVVSLPIEGVPDSSSAQAIAYLPDDSLLVVSSWNQSIKLIKLKKDGSLDLSFASRGFAEVPLDRIGSVFVNRLSVTYDQKSIVSGFNSDGGVSLVRQLPTGVADASFGPAGDGQVAYVISDLVDVNIHPNAKLCVDHVHKSADGESTNYSGSAFTVESAADGKIICSVGIMMGENDFVTIVIRLLDDGSLDKTFNSKGFLSVEFPGLINNLNSRALMQPDGKVVVSFRSEDFRAYIARYNENGTIDYDYGGQGTGLVSFPEWEYSEVASIATKGDGGIAVLGDLYDGSMRAMITSFTPEGKYQLDFNDGLPVFLVPERGYGSAKPLALQRDGRLVVGTLDSLADKYVSNIARYNSDGSIDETFCEVGYISLNDVPGFGLYSSLALTTDGRVTYLVKDLRASDSIVRILA